ncbi:MAG: RNA polymerase factor sigma-54 [Porticoccaceae bacterium]|nr:RNA polymerase factor sigma-54 [Porticoccaceae bacterium]
MKQSLQLKIGHQLSMTPQLQQAIKLLQLSSTDLHLEIQQALYSNPMLELADEIDQASDSNTEIDTETGNEDIQEPLVTANDDMEWSEQIPDELAIDAQWEDIYANAAPASASSSSTSNTSSGSADNRDFEEFHTVTESLQDHLLWQLNLTPLSDLDRIIATTIIDNISDNGFLLSPIEDLWESTYADYQQGLQQDSQLPDATIELDEMLAVLHRIQQFDPPGVAASDLRESLLIQLNQLSIETPWLEQALIIVDRYLPLVAERNFPALARKSGLDEASLEAVIGLIQTLSPRPGEAIGSQDSTYVEPDVSVRKIEGHWLVSLNSDLTPKLCINQQYAKLVQRANASEDNTFLRDHLQEARWFLRSLESRNETLMRVSRTIVDKQQGFLDHGPEAMKPMILADIAELLGLHESTISRVTTQKYMDTPRGVYELKYFFSSHVNTAAGGECSSTAIRAMLKRMIAAEPNKKPLSDSKLALMLQTEGIQVARRTVAKYRESMHIPSSSDRKRFKQSA